mgnify:CR=1 FL=1
MNCIPNSSMTLPVFSLLNAGSLCVIISPILGFLTFMVFYNSSKHFHDLLYRIEVCSTLGIYLCFYLYFHDFSHDLIVLNSISTYGPCLVLTTIFCPDCFFIGTSCNVTCSVCIFDDVNDWNVILTYPALNNCSNSLSILISLGLDGKNLSTSLLSAAADALRSYD